MEKTQSVEGFYQYYSSLTPHRVKEEVGHFNIFELENLGEAKTKCSSFGRKEFFKISLMKGRNRYYYGDKVAHIEKYALVFSNPHVPYHWEAEDEDQSGVFCIFTADFFHHSGVHPLREYPVFKDLSQSVIQLDEQQYERFRSLFNNLHTEIGSDYYYKYDVLRNITMDIIHSALKIQSVEIKKQAISASERISGQFLELLERQFPIESPAQRLQMRSPADFSQKLQIHVNHLNKAVKEAVGKTTTILISERIIQEAKILLKHTQWTISEIAWTLGFEELPHLINYFKKNTGQTPKAFRNF